MFAGKSEELLRRIRRAEIAKQTIEIYKPIIDKRYSAEEVVSHENRRAPAFQVDQIRDLFLLTQDAARVIAIDEAQFFGPEIVDVVEEMASRGKRVIVAGLDSDFLARPFGPMPALMCKADYITKLLAVCVRCGNPANRTQKIAGGTKQIEIGGVDQYEARCRKCFVPYTSS